MLSISDVRAWVGWHRALAVFAATMGVLVLVATTGVLLDDRYLAGAPVWLKPLKFGLSFLVYAVSLSWVLGRMRRRTRWVAAAGTVFALASAAELALITLQAARGQESHFSARLTALDRAVSIGMTIMVIALWAASLSVAVAAVRHRFGDRAITTAVRLGLAISVLGAALGALMLIPTGEQLQVLAEGTRTLVGAHTVGAAHGGPGLPLTGWSTDGGDLRIPHFVGLHGLQALPLLAALLALPALALPEATRAELVRIGAGAYLALVLLTLVQALRGQPLLAPDPWTLAAAALIALGTALAVGTALRRHGAMTAVPRAVA